MLSTLGDSLHEKHHIDVRVLPLDLADPAAIEELADATADLDIGLLVAAAGYGIAGDFLSSHRDEQLAMLDVNCRAVTGIAHVYISG